MNILVLGERNEMHFSENYANVAHMNGLSTLSTIKMH